MELNIPDNVRGWIYVSIIFLMPTLTYLSETDRIGTAEVALALPMSWRRRCWPA
jgi:hypothetical protein